MTTNNETAISDSPTTSSFTQSTPSFSRNTYPMPDCSCFPDAGHGAQSQHVELFLANARLLLNSGN
jgi:hypothetical protein